MNNHESFGDELKRVMKEEMLKAVNEFIEENHIIRLDKCKDGWYAMKEDGCWIRLT